MHVRTNLLEHITLVCVKLAEQAEADEVRRLAEEAPQQWAMSFEDRRVYDNVR